MASKTKSSGSAGKSSYSPKCIIQVVSLTDNVLFSTDPTHEVESLRRFTYLDLMRKLPGWRDDRIYSHCNLLFPSDNQKIWKKRIAMEFPFYESSESCGDVSESESESESESDSDSDSDDYTDSSCHSEEDEDFYDAHNHAVKHETNFVIRVRTPLETVDFKTIKKLQKKEKNKPRPPPCPPLSSKIERLRMPCKK